MRKFLWSPEGRSELEILLCSRAGKLLLDARDLLNPRKGEVFVPCPLYAAPRKIEVGRIRDTATPEIGKESPVTTAYIAPLLCKTPGRELCLLSRLGNISLAPQKFLPLLALLKLTRHYVKPLAMNYVFSLAWNVSLAPQKFLPLLALLKLRKKEVKTYLASP